MKTPRGVLLGFMLLGAVATGFTAIAVRNAPGVYVAHVRVLISPPLDTFEPNQYVTPGNSAIAVGGVVAAMVDPSRANRFSSPDATLSGAGARHGSWVKLPDSGGQWASAFYDPWLDVQVVDTDPAVVSEVMSERLTAIDEAMTQLQDNAGVSSANRFITEISPPSGPQIYYERGRVNAGAGMALVLGGGLTVAFMSWLSRWLRLRHRPSDTTRSLILRSAGSG